MALVAPVPRAAPAAQVALVPGSAFGSPECVRLSYAASDETLEEALDRIEKALKEDVYRVNKE